MWRNAYQIEWCETENYLCVKASWNGETFVFAPFGGHTDTLIAVVEKLTTYFNQLGQPLLIKGATRIIVEILHALRPGHFVYRADRDNYDYIYLTQDLIELKGRKFSSKKNHLNSFLKSYPEYKYLPISKALVPSCIDTALAWYNNRDSTDSILAYEKEAIIEVLNSFEHLALTGGVILVDDEVKAFAFGEALNDDTAVIHIEKGNPEIRGVYQIINQQFCLHAWSHYKYVNREEDMGIRGLREAKHSYHPIGMIKKYDIRLCSMR